MRPEIDVAVIGAGVVGLACAAELARAGRSVVVIERHGSVAQETSARNSEVIHAGIYYPTGSHKAELCVAGRELLYRRCRREGIPHRRTGKLIVAADEAEVATLERLRALGAANGVPGLELVTKRELARLEPGLRGVAALLSPETGIVDAHALSLSFAAEAEAGGAMLALRTGVEGVERAGSAYRVRARGADGAVDTITCVAVVNAAGLAADRVAALAGIDVDARGYRIHPCKGDYFAIAPGAGVRVSRLVYPVPAGPGLGIHATVDLGGRVRLGPDAEYVDTVRYDVDPGKAERFAEAARRYLPEVRAEWLSPDYAGVRPRLAGPGEGFRDFVVAEESCAGLPGFVNALGTESPGLTAAPAIAARVAALLERVL